MPARRASPMTRPNPTPIVGGALLPRGADTATTAGWPAGRCLSFTGDALASDLYALGNPVVELSHAADNPARRSVRAGERGRCPWPLAQCQRRLPTPDRHIRAWSCPHRTRRRWPTGSAPGRGSGCSSPVALIRGSAAISAPKSRRSPARRLVPATHTVHYGDRHDWSLPATPGRPSADRAADPVGDPL